MHVSALKFDTFNYEISVVFAIPICAIHLTILILHAGQNRIAFN
jgi:hypothetical protein